MMTQDDLKMIDKKIQVMKSSAEELKRLGDNFPALARNSIRILASLKMLEINVSDLVELASSDSQSG